MTVEGPNTEAKHVFGAGSGVLCQQDGAASMMMEEAADGGRVGAAVQTCCRDIFLESVKLYISCCIDST